MGPMGWRGLLRVVDFQELLTAQPVLAAALDKAQRSGGTKSPEAKALREGCQLLARTLWTRRASIERVHDQRPAGPEGLREELVSFAEGLRLRGLRDARSLRLVERRGEDRLRREELLEVHDAQEAAPSHGTHHGPSPRKACRPLVARMPAVVRLNGARRT